MNCQPSSAKSIEGNLLGLPSFYGYIEDNKKIWLSVINWSEGPNLYDNLLPPCLYQQVGLSVFWFADRWLSSTLAREAIWAIG
jgi:hypothetical protein